MLMEPVDASIRDYAPEDAAATARIFHQAVRDGAAGFYTLEQRRAWSPAPPDIGEWRERLAGQQAWVAVVDDAPVGFMTLAEQGYIDLAFVAPAQAGRGVGRALYERVEQAAIAVGAPRLHTLASLVARPFFARRGFQVVRRNLIERRGVTLANFTMEKLSLGG